VLGLFHNPRVKSHKCWKNAGRAPFRCPARCCLPSRLQPGSGQRYRLRSRRSSDVHIQCSILGTSRRGSKLHVDRAILTISLVQKIGQAIALVDVLVLAGLYTLRLEAGSAATRTPISHWLAGFAIFLFLSLAMVKRFAELEKSRANASQPKNGRGYLLADIEQIRSFGTASAYASVVIFAIYISGQDVMTLYHKPSLLWLIVPLMIQWLSRVWLLAARGELNEDPVVFALTDPMSLLIGAAVAAVSLLAI
jgi:4-hydroxybenzoate polyprenyltransferase